VIRMLIRKSVLARLLANENIIVEQGNYPTAWFDVQKRELGLPLWKEMSKDIYDLLVGHEVGHALETPVDFHLQIAALKIPHSYLNIVEDIRIEKKILAKYPGLVMNFKRGYSEMMFDLNLFEIAGKDLNKLGFMDRLNIKAKGRDLVDVPFSDEELPFFQKAMAVDTFEEVIAVCVELVAWLKSKKKKVNPDDDKADEAGNDGEAGNDAGNDSDAGDDGGEGDDADGEASDSDEEGDAAGKADESDEEGDEGVASGSGKAANDPSDGDDDTILDEASTVEAYDRNQAALADSGTFVVKGMSREMFDFLVVPYERIAESRRQRTYATKFPQTAWDKFQIETKQVVNLMVKDFEMRKQAQRTLRARTSTKGSLDVNKLHSYKYDDNLFKQVTTLADSKNHGMVMLVDYSGSMYNVLPDVIRQTLALIMFCKRVNIPFEVYSFTSSDSTSSEFAKKFYSPEKSYMMCEDLVLNHMFSSSMTKQKFEEASRMFFMRTASNTYCGETETLRNTPLNAALIAMQYVISDFRKKYNVEKMNFIALTDGDSNPCRVRYGRTTFGESSYRRDNKNVVEVNGKYVDINTATWGKNAAKKSTTENLLNEIRALGVKTINFFVCENNMRNSLASSGAADGMNWGEAKALVGQLRSKGVLIVDKNSGYDRRFIISSKSLNNQIAELNFDDDASAKQIGRAFSKAAGSKKNSRILTQKFSEIIA
jgi:hypothetical protein